MKSWSKRSDITSIDCGILTYAERITFFQIWVFFAFYQAIWADHSRIYRHFGPCLSWSWISIVPWAFLRIVTSCFWLACGDWYFTGAIWDVSGISVRLKMGATIQSCRWINWLIPNAPHYTSTSCLRCFSHAGLDWYHVRTIIRLMGAGSQSLVRKDWSACCWCWCSAIRRSLTIASQ
jgi:hypothetical protein